MDDPGLLVDTAFGADGAQQPVATGSGLGIESEVRIVRTRRTTAKLDEDRLLGVNGLPKVRKAFRKRLPQLRKGQEFTDIGNLLNSYQLWLDEMYPKAKFIDGLKIIEKLGHTRRIQLVRQEWIDESKSVQTEHNTESCVRQDHNETLRDHNETLQDRPEPDLASTAQLPTHIEDVPPEDELDDLLNEPINQLERSLSPGADI